MTAPLEPGAAAPVLTFTDITGRHGHSDDYAGWFIVYSIADRNSAGALMQWRERAHRTLVARYRDLAIAHISIADLTAVPGVLRGVVRPVLRTINRQATQRMTEALQAAATADARQTYVLVPDWTGDHLAAFGLAEAAEAHCWIVSGGRIAAHLRGGSRDVEPQFVATFDRLCAAQRPAMDLVPPGVGR